MAIGKVNVGGGNSSGGFLKIFTGTTQPTNPREGDIWIKDNIIIKNVIIKTEYDNNTPDGSIVLLVSSVPSDMFIKYYFDLINRNDKLSIFHYIKGILFRDLNNWKDISSKIYIGGKWEFLSGKWDETSENIISSRWSFSNSIVRMTLENINNKGIVEKASEEIRIPNSTYDRSSPLLTDGDGNIYTRVQPHTDSGKIVINNKDMRLLSTINSSTPNLVFNDSNMESACVTNTGHMIARGTTTQGVYKSDIIQNKVIWTNVIQDLTHTCMNYKNQFVVAFSTYVVSNTTKFKIHKISIENGLIIETRDAFPYINYYCVSRDGFLYYTSGTTLCKVNLSNLTLVYEKPLPTTFNNIRAKIEVSIDGTELTAVIQGNIYIFDTTSGDVKKNLKIPFASSEQNFYAVEDMVVTANKYIYVLGHIPNGNIYDKMLKFYNPLGQEVWSIKYTSYTESCPRRLLYTNGRPEAFLN